MFRVWDWTSDGKPNGRGPDCGMAKGLKVHVVLLRAGGQEAPKTNKKGYEKRQTPCFHFLLQTPLIA